jgi:hypothetical protein
MSCSEMFSPVLRYFCLDCTSDIFFFQVFPIQTGFGVFHFHTA